MPIFIASLIWIY